MSTQADQIQALTAQVASLMAAVQAQRLPGVLYPLVGSACTFGMKVTEGFSATDMILALDGQASGDSANLNPDGYSPPARPEQYFNIAMIYGETFFRDDVNVSTLQDASLTVATAPGTGYHRYDIVYAYVGAGGVASVAIAAGSPVVNASSPLDPTLPTGTLALARVHVEANVTGIANAKITDLRDFNGRLRGTAGVPGLVWLGTWDSGTAYVIGDAVFDDGSAFICTAGNTNQEPPNITYWNELNLGIYNRGNWATATVYNVNDVVKDAATTQNIYICQTAHTSGTLATDVGAGKWLLWVDNATATTAAATATTQAGIATTEAGIATTQAANAAASAIAAATSGIQVAAAGGTVDAITATFTTPLTLTDKICCRVVCAGANTGTTLTFAPDGLTPHNVKKLGGASVRAGDIPAAGFDAIFQYQASDTHWELLNPAYGAFNPAAAGALAGVTTVSASGQITSTLATGTAPLVVTSTTQVANLNAALAGNLTGTPNITVGTIGCGAITSTGAVAGVSLASTSFVNVTSNGGAANCFNYVGPAADDHKCFTATGSTTGATWGEIANTGNTVIFGVVKSTGGGIAAGATAYAAYFGSSANVPVQFGVNGTVVQTLTSTGINSTAIGATTPSTGAFTALSTTTTVSTGSYTVATLPAAGTTGRIACVTDATTPTYLGALTGGGAVKCSVFDNGTAWVSA